MIQTSFLMDMNLFLEQQCECRDVRESDVLPFMVVDLARSIYSDAFECGSQIYMYNCTVH